MSLNLVVLKSLDLASLRRPQHFAPDAQHMIWEAGTSRCTDSSLCFDCVRVSILSPALLPHARTSSTRRLRKVTQSSRGWSPCQSCGHVSQEDACRKCSRHLPVCFDTCVRCFAGDQCQDQGFMSCICDSLSRASMIFSQDAPVVLTW